MIVILLLLIINAIAVTLGISKWYAQMPITFGLVFIVMAVNYECKNILSFGESKGGEVYVSIGFGDFKSFYGQTLVWVSHQAKI